MSVLHINSRLTIFVSLIFLLSSCSTSQKSSSQTPPAGEVLSSWVEMGPDHQQILRVVMSSPPCPSVQTQNGEVALIARGTPDKNFPVQVCEGRFPTPSGPVTLNGKAMPLLQTDDPQRILVLGDTGCRLKPAQDGHGAMMQACNDPVAWPFGKISKAAADWKPDLIIHTGDYHYREGKCPEGDKTCTGATAGDVWESWKEDFNAPTAPLLEAAPWIMVRGNHENCLRGGQGWFLLFEPGPMQSCTDSIPPYDVRLRDYTIHVVDSTQGDYINPSLEKLQVREKGFNWIVSHRPFVTPGAIEDKYDVKIPASLAKRGQLSVVMAGHWHFANLLTQPGKGRAAEFIIGNGGTALDKDQTPFLKQKGVVTRSAPGFGFMTMEKQKTGIWKVVLHDTEGKDVKRCLFRERAGSEPVLLCRH